MPAASSIYAFLDEFQVKKYVLQSIECKIAQNCAPWGQTCCLNSSFCNKINLNHVRAVASITGHAYAPAPPPFDNNR
jgi:hypothetical protein